MVGSVAQSWMLEEQNTVGSLEIEERTNRLLGAQPIKSGLRLNPLRVPVELWGGILSRIASDCNFVLAKLGQASTDTGDDL